jgi:ketosteroid isomerase-like protein
VVRFAPESLGANPTVSGVVARDGRVMSAKDVMDRYVAAARRRDLEAAFGHFAEDIVFRIPGRSRYAGEHRGREAAMSYIDDALALSREHEMELEVIDALVSEDRFALIVVERFHLDGRVVEIPRTNVYRVRGEQIDEIWIFEGDQYAADALMAGV